ncbi:N-acetylmuramoyl-L-alanine amidase family protein [Clostridium saccharobutylicum]|uniref:SigA binding protein n=1 Tax=Clostridium saccharobutylicum DSM 13864 TaxID=1345695 RepID=U5N049_CLOSA|nr:N-acetylmuramoyl-L-alanine amidase family protein [Clostridium saccharobutylicum]AGX45157.1 SigA binding protein [Clostridium saccharobutylicum DSM 13864]AQR92436.1 autolysin [Clostridium saccharobutylicum]AQS02339.1 autolysin [Clostridium saccharobutylicum]AQS16322.1 autolysin [Clostridium saccharobutylicum]MBA2905000.1 glucan-binding YG repeat protein [Clostridium saccharobutylicum]
MFKRSTKITSLLVVAASVASMVPAYAADYKRIESQDGKVYNAQAYKDGVAVIDGNVKDGDTDAIYYLKDGKYTELDGVSTGDSFDGVHNAKYLDIQDGDNFVDLTSGKVTDDNMVEDDADDAAANLKKKIKSDNDGRYSKTDADATKDGKQLTVIPGAKYGATWYSTSYDVKNASEAGVAQYEVYTDANGNYIDADYNIGKIKVEAAGKSVTLKNTDTDDLINDDDTKATVKSPVVIGQDKDYIYRTATIEITNKTKKIDKVNGVKVTTGSAVEATGDDKTVALNVIQKISKAQDSDKADGARYAKNVTTYVISDEDAKLYSGDKANLLTNGTTKYTVVNGKVIAYNKDLHLAATIELKTKSAYYYADVNSVCDDDVTSFDTDTDGNLWMLNDGFVYEWNNDEDWNKVYKVDGAMINLSVYDKDNMVVWSDDSDEVYSVIGSKTKDKDKDKDTTTTTTTTTAQVGWVQNTADGSWAYYENGAKVTNGWRQTNGTWYFLNADGVMMQNGWLTNGGAWYYLAENGAMKTGWIQVSGNWYYLAPSGAMKTGWFQDTNGTWYYANESGVMLHDTTVGGYTLGSNGALV